MQLDHFQVTREIARGGMGVVYEAYDTLLQRPVAIKLVGQPLPRRRERFQREIQALARLRHPHVVPVLSAGEHEGRPYMVMELVEGQTLQELIDKGGPLSGRKAAALHQKLADALAGAHASGILHRDLKPANVLIRADGEPLLTDFGLALDLSRSGSSTSQRLSHDGAALGTPGYWPPEQAAGDLDKIGPASDVYGLGATLYTALTGGPPFGDSFQVVEGRAGPRPPSALQPQLDSELDAICLRCLEPDTTQRFPTARALADALGRYLQGAGSSPPAGSRSTVPQVLAVALLMAGALGAGWVLRGAPAPERVSEGAPELRPSQPTESPAQPVQTDTPEQSWPHTEFTGLESGQVDPAARAALEEGNRLFQQRDLVGALAALGRALEIDPEFVEAHNNRGVIQLAQRDLPAALRDFDRALELNPSHTGAYCNRGNAHAANGDWRAAIDDWTRYLQDRDEPVVWHNRAEAFEKLGEYARAVEDCTRAIELDPDLAEAWDLRAIARTGLGDRRGAIGDWDRFLELRPGNLPALANRGNVRAKLGDYQGAIADLTLALESLRPEDPMAQRLRGVLQRVEQQAEAEGDR